MNLTIEKFQQAQVRKDLPALRPGDTVRIHVRLKEAEGEKERIQPFEGVVIKKRGKSTGASFTVRRVSFGVGVERVPHAGNLTVLNAVRSRENVEGGTCFSGIQHLHAIDKNRARLQPSGTEVASSHIHRNAMSERRDSGSG